METRALVYAVVVIVVSRGLRVHLLYLNLISREITYREV